MFAARQLSLAVTLLTVGLTARAADDSAATSVLSIKTPIVIREKDGTNEVSVDTGKADLSLRLWKVHDTYNIEAAIDVSQVNQAILPTDARGNLTKDAKRLAERPFIRFYPPGGEAVTIDINCDRRRCRAVWPKIPLKADGRIQSFQAEVNIRGLRGKHWLAGYNQAVLGTGAAAEVPPKDAEPTRTVFMNFDSFWPGSNFTPLQRNLVSIDTLEQLEFKESQHASTGFRKYRKLTRYGLVKGGVTLEISNGDYLETRDLNEGDVLWVLPGQVASLSATAPFYKEARLVKLEFDKSAP